VRIDDYKYRFIDQPGRLAGDKTKPDVPYLINLASILRAHRLPNSGTKREGAQSISTGFKLRVLAPSCLSAAGGKAGDDRDRVSADAERARASISMP